MKNFLYSGHRFPAAEVILFGVPRATTVAFIPISD